MGKQRLYCKLCHQAVSHPLRLDQEVREFSASNQDDSIRIPADEAWVVEVQLFGQLHSSAKQVWFSPLSLSGDVKTDLNTFGCCGYFGSGNARCKAGHIVGSRIDECAHQPRFEPNPQMTYWAAAHDGEI